MHGGLCYDAVANLSSNMPGSPAGVRLLPKPDTTLPPVLVVENDLDDAFFAQRLLLKVGVRNPLVLLEDGEQAIAFLRHAADADRAPCAVLLDIKMPKRDGFEVLEWVRRHPALASVRVAMLSSSDAPQDLRRASELGADEYFVKFPSPAAVRRLLAGHCSLDHCGVAAGC